MSRLPKPGSDTGQWGTILNDFLLAQHNTDGTHPIGSILQVPAGAGLSLVSDASQPTGFAWTAITKTTVGLSNVTNDAQVKVSDVDTDATLAANSDGKISSQKAVKAYIDAGLATKVNTADALAFSVAL